MTLNAPRRFRGTFRQDVEARAVYSENAGIQRIDPTAVAVPADADDLAALVEWARGEEIGLICRGSGSGMAGGAIGRGVIVDLSRWKNIDTEALESRRLTIGPGTICRDVEAAVRPASLRLPVSPSSAPFCTIGGMTATNAAGAHSLAFGTMRDWVTGIECLLDDGTLAWIRRGETSSSSSRLTQIASQLAKIPRDTLAGARHAGVRKESSGYATARYAESGDLVDLLVGSEGTLACFTGIEIRLTSVPRAVASVMGVFPSLAAATEAAVRARAAGAVACELLDRTFLEFVGGASGMPVDASTEAILLADVEADTLAAAAEAADLVARSFSSAGAAETRVAADHDTREALWSLRHAASPMLNRLSERLRSMQFIEDGAVPPARLGEYVAGIRRALDRQQIRGVIFGHAGDGHVHVNPLIDVSAPGWRRRLEDLLAEVTELVVSLGGTMSGEHGDGRLRTPLLARAWDSTSLAAFAAVKSAFDPAGRFNPGVKFGGDASIGPIKYDPDLPPLPHRAAAVLAQVERARDYAAFRLDLLGD